MRNAAVESHLRQQNQSEDEPKKGKGEVTAILQRQKFAPPTNDTQGSQGKERQTASALQPVEKAGGRYQSANEADEQNAVRGSFGLTPKSPEAEGQRKAND